MTLYLTSLVRLSIIVMMLGAGMVAAQTVPSPVAPAASHTLYLPQVMAQPATSSGALLDGGVVEAGAILGAVVGTLDRPLPVDLAETSAPAIPLAAGTPIGAYYRLAAGRLALAPAAKPFLVGLPVPAGTVTDNLAAAVLLPAGVVLGDDTRPRWGVNTGHYDAANQLFVITLAVLRPVEITMVLVSDPAYAPRPVALRVRTAAEPPRFELTCGLPSHACTAANKAWLVLALQRAFTEFVTDRHFREPALDSTTAFFTRPTGTWWKPEIVSVDNYENIWILDGPCDDEAGSYTPDTKQVEICLDPTVAPGGYEQRTVRHEFFHAIQHAYTAFHEDVLANREQTKWISEGSASAAEMSSFPLQRSPDQNQRRSIGLTLVDTSDVNDYLVQDFWVYTGLARGQGLSYLQPILEAGGTPEHVYTVLQLDAAYWFWIKNQTFEKEEQDIDVDDDAADDFASPKCAIEQNLVQPMIDLPFPSQQKIKGTLAPLQSVVVRIEFQQVVRTVFVHASAGARTADLRYKVFENGEANCADVPDGLRRLEIISAPVERPVERYVILSNVSATDALTFELGVSGG